MRERIGKPLQLQHKDNNVERNIPVMKMGIQRPQFLHPACVAAAAAISTSESCNEKQKKETC